MPISDLRKEYHHDALNLSSMAQDPLEQFSKWFDEAVKASFLEPNAMVLATADPSGAPSARVVLLKQFDQRGFCFFSNYLSQKGRELEKNSNVAAVFYWDKIERQIRIVGSAKKVTTEESEAYFLSRPIDSQVAASISEQSKEIDSREALDSKFETTLASTNGKPVERPAHWGGYRIEPARMEFWQGRPNRMHDRIVYERAGSDWNRFRIQP